MERYIIPQYIYCIYNDNRVVLVNIHTGEWIKISKEIWGIIKQNENKASFQQIKESFPSQRDKDTLDMVEKILFQNGIITSREDEKKFIFTIALTKRCNLYCKHCSYNAVVSKNEIEDELSTDEIKNIIRGISLLNLEAIVFTGGEPLIRDDFLEILSFTKEQFGGKISVMTNGTLINRKNALVLAQCATQIDISVDGVDDESCERIRGKGVFSKVIESVHLLQEIGFSKISLSMVRTSFTEDSIEIFKKLNRDLGTQPVLREFAEIGRGKTNSELLKTKKRNNIVPQNSVSLLDIQKTLKCSRCGACYGSFFIDYNGDIYGCANLKMKDYCLGNIRDTKCYEYFERGEYEDCLGYQSLFEDIPKRCKQCKVNIFCINCLVDVINKGNSEEFDTYCKNREKFYTKLVWEMN